MRSYKILGNKASNGSGISGSAHSVGIAIAIGIGMGTTCDFVSNFGYFYCYILCTYSSPWASRWPFEHVFFFSSQFKISYFVWWLLRFHQFLNFKVIHYRRVLIVYFFYTASYLYNYFFWDHLGKIHRKKFDKIEGVTSHFFVFSIGKCYRKIYRWWEQWPLEYGYIFKFL